MDRMLRKKKDNSDYEIDRELTGKFAIEKNAEYQDRIAELEEENKELKEINKSQNEEIQRFKDNAMADMTEITRLELENKKLKHENSYRAGIVDILPKGKGHVAEETIQDLQARINELKEENEDLKQIIKLSKSYEEGKNKLKEVYIKNTAKFLDKKFPKINGFIEEDTLQELKDLGKI